MHHLKENIQRYNGLKNKNLSQDIEEVIKIGDFHGTQEEMLKKAMDSMRLVGNKAVHPSELDLNDNSEIADILFEMLNFIVEEVITKPTKNERKSRQTQSSNQQKLKRQSFRIITPHNLPYTL